MHPPAISSPTSSLLAHRRIAIVGGGPAGLVAARLLQLAGASVTVYERDSHAQARLLGGSLDIRAGSGQRALAAAGLLDDFLALARPVTDRMADKHGQVLYELTPTPDDLHERPEVDRPDFRTLLLAALAPGTVGWQCPVTKLTAEGARLQLHFADEAVAPVFADLVLLADGANSRLRRYVTDQQPVLTGTFVVQGEVYKPAQACPAAYQLAGAGNLAAVEDQKALFLHSKRNGHLSFYASLRLPPATEAPITDWQNQVAVSQYLSTTFADWAPVYHALFRASDEYRGLQFRYLPLQQPWASQPNVTLLGDAAHAMPPYGGYGANLGLVDALNLVEQLTSGRHLTIAAALAAYEQQLFTYAPPVQEAAVAADERMHTQTEKPAQRLARILQQREVDKDPQWQ